MTIPEYYDKCRSINATSRKFGISHTKVRKILISQGVDIGEANTI